MYRYETHLHTCITSACSIFTPKQIVEKYTRLGFDGVFVSDHFLNGNTTVPRDLPWQERISAFFEGYRALKEEAKGKISVFFAFEYSYLGTDFLVYGLSEQVLLAHPEMMQMSVKEFCAFVKQEGGAIIQAHPFRESPWIDHIRLFPSNVDGLETINACRDERCNRLADNLANEYGLYKLAGSDIHRDSQQLLAGIQFETPLTDELDFVARIKRGEGRTFSIIDEKEV